MTSAGRILIMPKGNYDPSATYEMLDLVIHNGKSWLARKTVTGIEPSDASNEHWHDLVNITAENVGALSKHGGELNGDLYIKKAANGYVLISKNHSSEADYGLDIFDYDSDGNKARLSLKANDSTENAIGITINGGNYNRLFGEHNLSLLNAHLQNKANGGTIAFTENPGGNDYVVHTFNIDNQNDIMFFANTIATDNIYVAGINIINYQPNSIEVRFALNQAYSKDIIFMVAYMKSI